VDPAYGILMNGIEDDEIQDYFINSAFPSAATMQRILDVLSQAEGLSFNDLLSQVNTPRAVLEKALKLLEVDGAVNQTRAGKVLLYFRTPNRWTMDASRIEQVTQLRRAEQAQVQAYVRHQGCLMEFLTRALDDPHTGPCGICANCQGRGFTDQVPPGKLAEAEIFLGREEVLIEPRKRWPQGFLPGTTVIAPEHLNATGRALCYYGDRGLGTMVRNGKYSAGRFGDELVKAAADYIRLRWRPDPAPQWIAAIPSRRHPTLVIDFARRLAAALNLPFAPVLACGQQQPEQKTMANSYMQARNVHAALTVAGSVPPGPVLLVDDIMDSGWTMTLAGWLLRTHGSGVVHPFSLARTKVRS
jgi:ATP-dependent DNA helicase RecQ